MISWRTQLSQIVAQEGLILLGVTDLNCQQDFNHFQKWLDRGFNAGMDFLKRNLPLRSDPSGVFPGSRTAIVLALSYGNKSAASTRGPNVAEYARYQDYHKVLRSKGQSIINKWNTQFPGNELRGRIVVDSAPVLERAMAAKTLQGFIGKNTMYIHPELGSFLLLGVILVDHVLDTDQKSAVDPKKRIKGEGGCGTCKRCQVHCPTGALSEDYVLDATKCLAYWSIEHRGEIPLKFWPHFRKYFFGCDICQLVCPYNRAGMGPKENQITEIPTVAAMTRKIQDLEFDLEAIALMDQAQYEAWFGGTPMTRAKIFGLKRNALIAMTVTKHLRWRRTAEIISESSDLALSATAKTALAYGDDI